MRSLRRVKLRGKRVLLRVDFNVLPLRPEEPRIKKTLPTIEYLLRQGAKVILLTHLETNEGRTPPLWILRPYLRKFLPLEKLVIFENLRKFPGEKSANWRTSLRFAKKLSRFGDIYVNEAFSASHRPHASIVLLPKLLPAYPGFLFEAELGELSKILTPFHPLTLILGGAKTETKLPLLKKLLSKTDYVLLGGDLVNVFLKKQIIKSKKIIWPERVIQKNGRVWDVDFGKSGSWTKIIKSSKLIVWNGPLGFIEKGYTRGTRKLVSTLGKSRTKIIIGGGDTTDSLPRGFATNPPKNIFVSSAGGAMLEYLAKGTLPGIRALEIRN